MLQIQFYDITISIFDNNNSILSYHKYDFISQNPDEFVILKIAFAQYLYDCFM